MRADYDHKQVAFVTKSGIKTTCDEGMLEILIMLREMGVETLYSCEGKDFGAYVSTKGRTMGPVLRRAQKLARRGELSDLATQVVSNFETGAFEWDLAKYRHEKQSRGFSWGYHFNYRVRDNEEPHRYECEWRYSRTYGYRIVIRWPKDDHDLVYRMLKELSR